MAFGQHFGSTLVIHCVDGDCPAEFVTAVRTSVLAGPPSWDPYQVQPDDAIIDRAGRSQRAKHQMNWNFRSVVGRTASLAADVDLPELLKLAAVVCVIAGTPYSASAGRIAWHEAQTGSAALPDSGKVGEVRRGEDGQIEAVPAPAHGAAAEGSLPSSRPKSVRATIPSNSRLRAAQAGAPAVPQPPAQGTPAAASLVCPKGAITCLRLEPLTADRDNLPVTFGQVFADGDVPAGTRLEAKLDGKALPLQMDQQTSFSDGTLRFAVLSTIVPALSEPGILSIWPPDKSHATPAAAAKSEAGPNLDDITAAMTVYTPQISHVALGNRDGGKPGIPFELGEGITLRIGDEKHVLKVDQATAGGGYPTLNKLAALFVRDINLTSRSFRALQPNGDINYENFWVMSKADGKPFTVSFEYDGKAKLASDVIRPWAAPTAYSGSSKDAVQGKLNWLAGPIVTETSLLIPLRTKDDKEQPHLMLRANVRRYANGRSRYEFVIENDWSYVLGRQDMEYAVKISVGGHEVFTADDMWHDMQARWRTVWWRDGDPQVSIVRDLDYMMRSKAILQIDKTRRVSANSVNDFAKTIINAGVGPLQTSIVQVAMNSAGGRADIGMFPAWTMEYLFTQQRSMYQAMLGLANVSGSVPIHYREKDTDLPLTLDRHPGVALWYGGARSEDALPTPTFHTLTRWSGLDVQHQPSFVYVPYLLTGEHYYLEELEFWACWSMGHMDPQMRQFAKGLITPIAEERGQAWFMRTLVEATAFAPDHDPLKPYFLRAFKDNIAALTDRIRSNPLHNLPGYDAPHQHTLSPWSQDFMALALVHTVELGYKEALEPLDLLSDWVIGRFTKGPFAQHPWLGVQMAIPVRTKQGGDLLQDWTAVYEQAVQEHQGDETWAHFRQEDYAAQGQVVMARAAMAALSGVPIKRREEALHVYQFLRENGTNSLREENNYPAWAFAPRPAS